MAEKETEVMPAGGDVALPGGTGRPALKRFGRVCGSVVAAMLLAVLLVGGTALVLQRRGVSADFVRDRLVASLQREFGGGAKIDIGHVRIGGGESTFSTQVLDLVVRGPRGETLVSAPDARIDLSPAALARFEFSVERLTLDRTDVAIDISPEGVISVANLGVGTQEASPAGEIVASILAVLNGKMGVGGGPIPIVSVENGRLQINDHRRNTRFVLDHIAINADPGADGRPAIRIGGSTPRGRIVIRIAPGAEPLSFDLAIEQVTPADIGALLGHDLTFVNAELPIGLEFTAKVDENGKPQHVFGIVRLGHGEFLLDDPEARPIDLTHASARFDFNAAENVCKISDLAIDASGFSMTFAGSLRSLDETRRAWQLQLAGTNGKIDPLTADDKPIDVASITADATIVPEERKLTLTRMELLGPQFAAALNGEAIFDAAGKMALSAGLSLSRSDARAAMHLWPHFLAMELRSYLVKNFRSGVLDRLTVSADLSVETFQKMKEHKPIPEEAVSSSFALSDGKLQLIDGLPPLAGLSLRGKSSGIAASLKEMGATLALPSGRILTLSEGTFAAPNLARKPIEARAQFRAVAQADAVIEFLAQPGLQGLVPQNDQADGIKGQFDGVVSIALPLIDKLKPSDVSSQVKATISNVVAERFIGKDRFEAQQLLLTAQPGSMTLKGEGKVAGMTAAVDVVQPRPKDAEDAVVTFTVDDAARQKRGINLGPMLTGPVTVKVKSDFPVSTKTGLPVEVDLTKAAIDGLVPGWVKPAGKAARANFILTEKDGGYRVANLDLDGAAPTIKGTADIAADGSINAFQLSSLKLSPGDNMQAEGQKTPTGFKISLHGNSFDARPFLRGPSKLGQPQSPLAQKDIEIELKAVALSGFNGEIASNGDVKLLKRGAQIRQGTIGGRLNGDALIGKIVPKSDGSSQMALQTQNAGALLRFMDIYNRMQGGTLDAQVSLKDGREKGWFMVRNFDLRDEPALQRVAAVAVPEDSGDTGRGPIVSNANDVSFERMRVDFSRSGDQFDVSEGVMWGRELGGTITGQMDYARDKVNFSGTFVPAYGLNNAFAKIPIFGFFLTGNKNEGLFAVPFRITGKASAPSLTVNPIAAVSPGFLRKIFDFQALPSAQVDALPDQ